MNLYVFGNPDFPKDALALSLVPALKKRFPNINFLVCDPNELDLPKEKEWWVLDTVLGIDKVRFVSIDELKKLKTRLTLHDFDLAAHLLLVKKVKKDLKVKIIGLPQDLNFHKALQDVTKILSSSVLENELHNSYKGHRPE